MSVRRLRSALVLPGAGFLVTGCWRRCAPMGRASSASIARRADAYAIITNS